MGVAARAAALVLTSMAAGPAAGINADSGIRMIGPPYPDNEPLDNGEPGVVEPGSGVLEMHPNGYGFLRSPETNYSRERTDPFVPGTMIEKFGLREGVLITGMVQRQPPAARARGSRKSSTSTA